MTKRQLIDEIRRFNHGAQPQFLSRFDEASLRLYLDRLLAAQQQSVRMHSTHASRSNRLRKAS